MAIKLRAGVPVAVIFLVGLLAAPSLAASDDLRTITRNPEVLHPSPEVLWDGPPLPARVFARYMRFPSIQQELSQRSIIPDPTLPPPGEGTPKNVSAADAAGTKRPGRTSGSALSEIGAGPTAVGGASFAPMAGSTAPRSVTAKDLIVELRVARRALGL
jgi:hypothetical protein